MRTQPAPLSAMMAGFSTCGCIWPVSALIGALASMPIFSAARTRRRVTPGERLRRALDDVALRCFRAAYLPVRDKFAFQQSRPPPTRLWPWPWKRVSRAVVVVEIGADPHVVVAVTDFLRVDEAPGHIAAGAGFVPGLHVLAVFLDPLTGEDAHVEAGFFDDERLVEARRQADVVVDFLVAILVEHAFVAVDGQEVDVRRAVEPVAQR